MTVLIKIPHAKTIQAYLSYWVGNWFLVRRRFGEKTWLIFGQNLE